MDTLMSEIGRLSQSEKIDLLDALWEDLESDPIPVSLAQEAELQRRLESYRADPSRVVPWDHVKARLANR